MCYPDGEFIVGDRDVLLGVLDGAPVWISGPQFETWKHTQLVIDVVPGRGGGFSLETPEGMRFLSRGRAFTDAENELLAADAAADRSRLRARGPPARTDRCGGRRGRGRMCNTRSARRSRSAVVADPARIV